jgi:hypothetical protein
MFEDHHYSYCQWAKEHQPRVTAKKEIGHSNTMPSMKHQSQHFPVYGRKAPTPDAHFNIAQ